jgi:hypothetical protein
VIGSPGALARSGVQLSLPLFRRSGRLPRARSRAFVAKSGVSDPSSHLSVVPFSFGVPDGPPRREVRRMLGSRRAYRTTARSVFTFHRLARARGLSSRSRPAGTGRARAAVVDEEGWKASSELNPQCPVRHLGSASRNSDSRVPPEPSKKVGGLVAFQLWLRVTPLGVRESGLGPGPALRTSLGFPYRCCEGPRTTR